MGSGTDFIQKVNFYFILTSSHVSEFPYPINGAYREAMSTQFGTDLQLFTRSEYITRLIPITPQWTLLIVGITQVTFQTGDCI